MNDSQVLVVEDDKDLSNIYTIILRHAGYSVSQSFNGEEALAAIKNSEPDVILLDIFMPVMDGKTFLETFDLSKHPNVKVIVCSNTSDAALMEEMVNLGADKVVTKSTMEPSDLERLIAPYFY